MNTEEIWLPFSYQLEYRAYRKRNSSPMTVREEAPFSIRSVDPSEAVPVAEFETISPVRLAKGETDWGQNRCNGPSVPYSRHRLVQVDGRLFRPAVTRSGAEFTLENFEAARGERSTQRSLGFVQDYPLQSACPANSQTRQERQEDIHEFISDNRHLEFAKAHAAAADLILVDGVVMKPAIMPVIEIIVNGSIVRNEKREYGPTLRVLGGGLANIEQRGESVLFSLGQYDAAIEFLDEVAQRLGKIPIVDGSATIHAPHLAMSDLDDLVLQRFLKALNNALGSDASSHPTSAVRHWCDARDHVEAFRTGDAAALSAAYASTMLTMETLKNTRNVGELYAHARRIETLIDGLVQSADLDNQSLSMAM